MTVLEYRNAYVRCAFAGALAIAVLGCRNPESIDQRECVQTYEFGNTGCLVVTGQVVGSNGQPLPDARIFSRLSPDTGTTVFVFGVDAPDASGKFRVLARRMLGLAAPGRDTVRVVVGAFWPPTLGRDSVFVTATVAPVGQSPVPVDVRITLSVP